MLSIIIPIFNEENNTLLIECLKCYQKLKAEIILIDGGSYDRTLLKIRNTFEIKNTFGKSDFRIETLPNSSRLERIQHGLRLVKFHKIIIHHPRSILDKSFYNETLCTKSHWGAFTHKFDDDNPLLKFTSFYSNYIRGDIKGIFYLDHCFYLDNSLSPLILSLENVEIFEDTEISKILKTAAPPKRLKATSMTSSIRFKKNGILKQILLNQLMKCFYIMGVNHRPMNKKYEKGLNLNNKTSED